MSGLLDKALTALLDRLGYRPAPFIWYIGQHLSVYYASPRRHPNAVAHRPGLFRIRGRVTKLWAGHLMVCWDRDRAPWVIA